MPHETQQPPKALVIRWDNHTVRVECPYCLRSHGHTFPFSSIWHEQDHMKAEPRPQRSSKQRRSDCHDVEGGNYMLNFPWDDDAVSSYGWEVDRDDRTFVTVDKHGPILVTTNDGEDGRTLLPQYQVRQLVETDEDSGDEIDDLVSAANSLDLEDNGEEESHEPRRQQTTEEIMEELFSDPGYRKISYIAYCVQGDLSSLRWLLDKYPGDRLIGSVDEKGNTGVLHAATEENGLRTVRWLHDLGDPLDRANHYGRTPLMEAALWGRLQTVEYLCNQDINLTACDANGMRAIDLASDTDVNRKERTARAGEIYREPFNATTRRAQIVALLKRLTPSPLPQATHARTPSNRLAFFARKTDGDLEIVRPTELLPVPQGQSQKAFATLDRGPNYPFINAMSGYSHPGWHNVLDNNFWTAKAEILREQLGLEKNRSAASHVEPQLLAFLVERHSLYVFEDGKLRSLLRDAMPEYGLRPIVTVSKSGFCDKCQEFVRRFGRVFPRFRVLFRFDEK